MATSDGAQRASSLGEDGHSSTIARQTDTSCIDYNSSLSTLHSVSSIQWRQSLPLIRGKDDSLHCFSRSQSSTSSYKMSNQSTLQKSAVTNASISSLSCSSSTQGIGIQDFENEFSCVTEIRFQNYYKLNKNLSEISKVLINVQVSWDIRVNALKEFRGVICGIHNTFHKQEFKALIKDMEVGLITSLKDPRSQVIKEACITVSYLSSVLKPHVSSLGVKIIPILISLLVKPVRVITNSAEICTHFIIVNSPSPQLLHCLLTHGFPSKCHLIRRYAAKFMVDIVTHYEIKLLSNVHLVHDTLLLAIRDADEAARKFGRKAFLEYQRRIPIQANLLLKSLTQQEQKYIREDWNRYNYLSSSISQAHTGTRNEGLKFPTRAHLGKSILQPLCGESNPSTELNKGECKPENKVQIHTNVLNRQPPAQALTPEHFIKPAQADKSSKRKVSRKYSPPSQLKYSFNKKSSQSSSSNAGNMSKKRLIRSCATEKMDPIKNELQKETKDITETLSSSENNQTGIEVPPSYSLSGNSTLRAELNSEPTSEQKPIQKHSIGIQKTSSSRNVGTQIGSGLTFYTHRETLTKKNIDKIEEILENVNEINGITTDTEINNIALERNRSRSLSKLNLSKDLYSMLQRLQYSEIVEAFEMALEQAITDYIKKKDIMKEKLNSYNGEALGSLTLPPSTKEIEGVTDSIYFNKMDTKSNKSQSSGVSSQQPDDTSISMNTNALKSKTVHSFKTNEHSTINNEPCFTGPTCTASNTFHSVPHQPMPREAEVKQKALHRQKTLSTSPQGTTAASQNTRSSVQYGTHLRSTLDIGTEETKHVLISSAPSDADQRLPTCDLHMPNESKLESKEHTSKRKQNFTHLNAMPEEGNSIHPASKSPCKENRPETLPQLFNWQTRIAVPKETVLKDAHTILKGLKVVQLNNGSLENNEKSSLTNPLCQIYGFAPNYSPEPSYVALDSLTSKCLPYSHSQEDPTNKHNECVQEDLDLTTHKLQVKPVAERSCSSLTPRSHTSRTIDTAEISETRENFIPRTQNNSCSERSNERTVSHLLKRNKPLEMDALENKWKSACSQTEFSTRPELHENISKYTTGTHQTPPFAKTTEQEIESPKEIAIRFLRKAKIFYKLRKEYFPADY